MLDHGTVLGDYRILGELGEGGMGRVYLAVHTMLGRRVAIKRLHIELCADKQALQLFLDEARALSRIEHDNIINVTDFRDDDVHGCFLVMELLEGVLLHELCEQQGGLSLERALAIAAQIASALAAVHRAGIVHRDLKPDNISVNTDADGSDFVTIFDFGVAKLDVSGDRDDCTGGVVLGTPEYMSPEQALGQVVDERSDIYAFGVILFELVTGRRPFVGTDFWDIVRRHTDEPVPDPRDWVDDDMQVADGVAELVMACLQKDASERIGSMAEIELVLRELRLQLCADVVHPAATDGETSTRAPRRQLGRARLYIATAAIAVLVTSVMLIGDDDARGTASSSPASAPSSSSGVDASLVDASVGRPHAAPALDARQPRMRKVARPEQRRLPRTRKAEPHAVRTPSRSRSRTGKRLPSNNQLDRHRVIDAFAPQR